MLESRTSRGTRRIGLAAAALAVSLTTGVASAQTTPATPPSAADKARAGDLFKKSADAYRSGDFAKAIELLDEAYALDPQPVLVYNRARAAEGIGNVDAAISGYEKYLTEEPNTPDRGAIEQRLVTLKRQRDERAALERERDARRNQPAPAPAPVPTHDPAADQPKAAHSPYPYVVAGVGGVGILVGAILGGVAVSKNGDAANEHVQTKAIDLKDSADGLAGASTASFVIGGVLVAAGVAWWIIDHRARPSTRSAWLVPTANGIGGTFR